MLAANLIVTSVPVQSLHPDPNNSRLHSKKQICALAKAMKAFGFNNPILVDRNSLVIAGHGRLEAAKQLGLAKVPVIRLEHLTPEQVRAYRIADNRLAELAEWDEAALRIELQALSGLALDFDLTLTGFETAVIDQLLMASGASDPADDMPLIVTSKPPIAQPGDLWILGKHRLLCGDALKASSYHALMQGQKAQMVFTDPPYNVPISGHVLKDNPNNHGEFAMARGEMSEAEFKGFLQGFMRHVINHASDGSIHYICMDWRHMLELLSAGRQSYTELKNICVWNKTNGGMGSLYRSKHEMVAVFKNGTATHVNNIELGRHGRYRTNVWDYAGQTSPHANRDEELSMHPTVKPLQLVADAILDCSDRGKLVLDPFGGSGTTLIAAEKTGRVAHLIELEPRYVDVSIQRWQKHTGKIAILEQTKQDYETVAAMQLDREVPNA